MTELIQCPSCEGFGVIWLPRRGGNDPDGREITCERCEGGGAITEEREEAQ